MRQLYQETLQPEGEIIEKKEIDMLLTSVFAKDPGCHQNCSGHG